MLNLKKFPTKAYTFGVSRGEAKKVHVGEVLKVAEDGQAVPGPGSYSPKELLGHETPHYSFKHR